MDLIQLLSSGLLSYLILFFLLILNSIILPIPEETIIITSAYIAHLNLINKLGILFVLFLGILAGDNLAYWVGRSYGPQLLINKMKKNKFLKIQIERVERFIHKQGNKTVFFSRFLYGFRFYTPIIAGTVKMSYPSFFIYNILGAIIWVPSLYFISYIFAENLTFIFKSLGILKEFSYILLGIIIIIITFFLIHSGYKNFRDKKSKIHKSINYY